MKRNFSAVLKTIEGAPIAKNGKPFTLLNVAIEALLAAFDDEVSLSGEQKLARYNLALRIQNSDGVVEMTVEEVAQLKMLIGKAFAPLVVGQSYLLLDADFQAPMSYENGA